MHKAIVGLIKSLALLLDSYWAEYDRETSSLLAAMADYIREHGERR